MPAGKQQTRALHAGPHAPHTPLPFCTAVVVFPTTRDCVQRDVAISKPAQTAFKLSQRSTQHALHALPWSSVCQLMCLQADAGTWDCRYFARIADERMGPGDQAILVTHQPRWLSDWFWDETACHNLRQLVRGHLRGRARVHLAGQRHHRAFLFLFVSRHMLIPVRLMHGLLPGHGHVQLAGRF